MTVGVAVMAEKGRAIVLMADKLFTRGRLDLQAEEQTAKAFPFVNGWLALYAGNPTFAQAVVAHAATKWLGMKPAKRPTFQIGLMKLVHGVMRDELVEAIDNNVLRANRIDPKTWATKRSAFGEATRQRIENKIEDYCEDGGCELLICGFDPRGDGHILYVREDDYQDEPTFAAIGSGADLAEAQLAWRNVPGADDVLSVLFRAYEAKTYAELNAFVGKGTVDALLMLADGNVFALDPQAKTTLAKRVTTNRRVPKFPPALKGFNSVAIAPAQPSAQSQTASPPKVSQLAPSRPSIRPAARARRRQGSSHRSQPRRFEKR